MGNSDSACYKAYAVVFPAPFRGGERMHMFATALSADKCAKRAKGKVAALNDATAKPLYVVVGDDVSGDMESTRAYLPAVAAAALLSYEEGGQWAVYRFDDAGAWSRPKLVYMSGECRAAPSAPSAPSAPGKTDPARSRWDAATGQASA